jgi:hypothetical protein
VGGREVLRAEDGHVDVLAGLLNSSPESLKELETFTGS